MPAPQHCEKAEEKAEEKGTPEKGTPEKGAPEKGTPEKAEAGLLAKKTFSVLFINNIALQLAQGAVPDAAEGLPLLFCIG